jgi:hypothetical protein
LQGLPRPGDQLAGKHELGDRPAQQPAGLAVPLQHRDQGTALHQFPRSADPRRSGADDDHLERTPGLVLDLADHPPGIGGLPDGGILDGGSPKSGSPTSDVPGSGVEKRREHRRLVAGETLQQADRHRVLPGQRPAACSLALRALVADPGADVRQDGRPTQDLLRARGVAPGQCCDERRDVVVRRATPHAGRIGAAQATGRLENRLIP